MRKIRFTLPALVVALASPVALAHEGHGDPGSWSSPYHYLLEPVHALPVVFALLTLIAYMRMRYRSKSLTHLDRQ